MPRMCAPGNHCRIPRGSSRRASARRAAGKFPALGKTFDAREASINPMQRLTEPVHKVIITGTGRAGTTFLVQLLTEMGLDTGYTRASLARDYFEHCSAGLEPSCSARIRPTS